MAVAQRNPVGVWSTTGAWAIPTVQGSVPELWRILNRVLQAWRCETVRAKESLAPLIPGADVDLEGFDRLTALRWPFIQAFFTYITFFFMLENAYRLLYSHLNRLNREIEANAAHNKLPQRTAYIDLLWHIRNQSIAHFASTERPSPDSSAGTMLGVFTGTKEGRLDLEGICFGGMSVVGARPRETLSLPDSHVLCVEYLKQMDSVCDEYFGAVLTYLPKTVSGKDYRPASGPSFWPSCYFEIT
jgi:hypothetical protein